MRVWLNPDRMRAYNVSTEEVMKAIAEQSVIGRPGRTGQATGKTSQSLEYVLTYEGRYNKPEQYERHHHPRQSGRRDPAPQGHRRRSSSAASSSTSTPTSTATRRPPSCSSRTTAATPATSSRRSRPSSRSSRPTTFPPGMDYEISYDVSTLPRRVDRAGASTRSARRSCWWPWSCSSSWATGARR